MGCGLIYTSFYDLTVFSKIFLKGKHQPPSIKRENVKFYGLNDYFYNKAAFGAQRKKK